METKKNHFDLSLPHSIDSYLNNLLQDKQNPDKLFLSRFTLNGSKNYIAIISKEGFLESTSDSLTKLLGYSDEELKAIPITNILAAGDFKYSEKLNCNYFENILYCQNKETIKIRWRIIPETIEDAFAFVGWKIKL